MKSTAKPKEIKRSFRRLAIQFHPDKNKDEGAEVGFCGKFLKDFSNKMDKVKPLVFSKGTEKLIIKWELLI